MFFFYINIYYLVYNVITIVLFSTILIHNEPTEYIKLLFTTMNYVYNWVNI